MSDVEIEQRLDDLTPAQKLVYKVLEYEDDRLTQQEIADESLLADTTVRYSLYELLEQGLIEEEYVLADARKKIYSVVKC